MYKSKRIIAKIIDVIFILLCIFTINYFVTSFAFFNDSSNYVVLLLILMFLYLYFGYISYYINFSTIGKKIVGIKIVRSNNEAPTRNELFLREPICIIYVIFTIVYSIVSIIFPTIDISNISLLLFIGFEFIIFLTLFISNFEFWNKKHKIVDKNSPCHINIGND